jgi:hypothetical protein
MTFENHKMQSGFCAKAFARICKYRCSFMQAFAGITQASEIACSFDKAALLGASSAVE